MVSPYLLRRVRSIEEVAAQTGASDRQHRLDWEARQDFAARYRPAAGSSRHWRDGDAPLDPKPRQRPRRDRS
jgi:hypothetical protein